MSKLKSALLGLAIGPALCYAGITSPVVAHADPWTCSSASGGNCMGPDTCDSDAVTGSLCSYSCQSLINGEVEEVDTLDCTPVG